MNLLPCPFCGGTEVETGEDLHDSQRFNFPLYLVICMTCGGTGGLTKTDVEAIALWNTSTPQQDNAVAELTPEEKAKLYEGLEPYERF